MANRTLSDLPVTTVVAAADIIHCRQSTTDKSVSHAKIAEYVQTISDYSPLIVAVTGATHTISTTIRKQLLLCTIAGNCTMTFPGSFGDAKEIIIRNEVGSAANVIGLPNSEILYPGSEITFIWNGTSWIKRTFSTYILTGTAAPTTTPTFVGQTFVDATANNIYIATGTATSADWTFLQKRDLGIYSGTGLSIADTDAYDKYISAHTAATGLQEFNLPTLADNLGKRYTFQNGGTTHGLTYINSEEGANIIFKGEALAKIPLFMLGNYVTLLSTANGWFVEAHEIFIDYGMQSRSDWTNVHMGSAFTYDNKSAAVDFTGEKIVLASGNTCICLYDDGGVGAAGTVYVYAWTGTGIASNDEVVTTGASDTADVDEGTGSSKNVDYNIYHGFGISKTKIIDKFFVSTDATESGIIEQKNTSSSTSTVGYNLFGVDTNSFQYMVSGNGMLYFNSAASATFINTDDYYNKIILIF